MTVRYITFDEALVLCGILGDLKIRDAGLLDSALHRPQAAGQGHEAYPSLDLKVAALLQSLAKNHALFDGNQRLAWMACDVFLRRNGSSVVMSAEEVVDLVLEVASGELEDVHAIAARLRTLPFQRSQHEAEPGSHGSRGSVAGSDPE